MGPLVGAIITCHSRKATGVTNDGFDPFRLPGSYISKPTHTMPEPVTEMENSCHQCYVLVTPAFVCLRINVHTHTPEMTKNKDILIY